MKRFLVTASVVALMATGAHASVVDLTGGQVTGVGTGSGVFDNGVVVGTIDVWRNSNFFPGTLTQNSSGLGVLGSRLDSPKLDGRIDESLTFNFGWAVKLVSVTFGSFGHSDDADIYVNNVLVGNEVSDNPYFFGGLIASSFKIKADGFFDSFRVKSFEVASVPVPAAGFLLLGALGGLGALRRRKKVS